MKLKPEIQEHIYTLTDGLYKGYELQMDGLCKKLNLKCFSALFDDNNISGAVIKDDNGDTYSIYANREHPPARRRFTLAHDIGHYISYLNNSYSEEELRDKGGFEDRAVSYGEGGIFSDAETEASLIASELLMPKEKVEELMQKTLTPEEMADLFYVSASCMTVRLQSLYPNLMIV
jgi:Zn-dependent peptidase ImmA (M78 family)